MENQLTTKELFSKDSIQERFTKLLGKEAQGFITSVLQAVNDNSLLQKADPQTVLHAAATAASMKLPINQNLGFAWIVPYKGQAQFQMGWRGYVQLALRTGQYTFINAEPVYENQFKSFNRLTEELDADFTIEGEGEVVGYAAIFKLINGFSKTCYWTKEKVMQHAQKYSKTYNKKSRSGSLIHSPWNDESQFDAMALKTVLKNTLAKWGIMSIELQTAQLADQAVIHQDNAFEYVDNGHETIDIEAVSTEEEDARIKEFIEAAKTHQDLQSVRSKLGDNLLVKYQDALDEREKEILFNEAVKN